MKKNDDIELARQSGYNEASYIYEKKFKGFISRLKEKGRSLSSNDGEYCYILTEEEIDKIAGEELTE